jgi:hypothetical protein
MTETDPASLFSESHNPYWLSPRWAEASYETMHSLLFSEAQEDPEFARQLLEILERRTGEVHRDVMFKLLRDLRVMVSFAERKAERSKKVEP